MNVLVTSVGSDTGRILCKEIQGHDVRRTDLPDRATGDAISCELSHDEATDRLCKGIDAIVLVCEPDDLSDSGSIDYHSRCVYNLLTAAVRAGVDHIVQISSLSLFEGADGTFQIDERWAPSVTPSMSSLRHHVAEFVCREFARDGRLSCTCLRFGKIISGMPGDDELTEEAAVSAVTAALDQGPAGWAVYHVVSAGTRFVTDSVEEGLEVDPRRTP